MEKILSSSILSADFSQLKNQITDCEKAGVNWIHIDVMDGHFVPNLTMGPFIVETCRKITSLPLDCHLMIEKPENLVDSFISAGASIITIHPEKNKNTIGTLEKIRSAGIKAGIAINPETPASSIFDYLSLVDLVLVMTVHPGYSGQKYIPEMTQKIVEVSKFVNSDHFNIDIEVDGGITEETISTAYKAGANAFVAATAIFKHPMGIAAGVNALRGKLI